MATLHADEGGGIYYADPAADPALGLADVAGPETAGAAVAVSPFPAGLVFHSRPGAPNVVYLDFDGETVAGTEWNTSLGRTEIPVLAFSIDTDRATFSDDEQLPFWEGLPNRRARPDPQNWRCPAGPKIKKTLKMSLSSTK